MKPVDNTPPKKDVGTFSFSISGVRLQWPLHRALCHALLNNTALWTDTLEHSQLPTLHTVALKEYAITVTISDTGLQHCTGAVPMTDTAFTRFIEEIAHYDLHKDTHYLLHVQPPTQAPHTVYLQWRKEQWEWDEGCFDSDDVFRIGAVFLFFESIAHGQ